MVFNKPNTSLKYTYSALTWGEIFGMKYDWYWYKIYFIIQKMALEISVSLNLKSLNTFFRLIEWEKEKNILLAFKFYK